MGFLGNPEYGVEFTPIDFAGFAKDCGGKGYSVKKLDEAAASYENGNAR